MNVLRRTAASLTVYGLAHAVVDAISAGILLTLWRREVVTLPETGAYFVLYNLLAFGAQPLLGLVVDWSRQPRAAVLAGIVLVAAAATLFDQWPMLAVVVVGVGNALFHLGAGSIALNLTPGRAAAPGIFVAPGALGLFWGTYLGRADAFVAWPFVAGLAGLAALALMLPLPALAYDHPKREGGALPVWVPVLLLLVCIGVRSLVGFGVELPWKAEWSLAVGLVVLVAAGKAVGGGLADRLGWGRVTVGALCMAAPLLAFGAARPGPAMVGMLLINLTMAVTLVATANLLPGRPAFAFGLTCLALEFGSWPVLHTGAGAAAFRLPWIVFAATLGAAGMLAAGLRLAFRHWPTRFGAVHE